MLAELVPMRFQTFSGQHFGLMAFFVVVFVALVVYGRRHGDDERFRRGFAVLMLCVCIPLQIAAAAAVRLHPRYVVAAAVLRPDLDGGGRRPLDPHAGGRSR